MGANRLRTRLSFLEQETSQGYPDPTGGPTKDHSGSENLEAEPGAGQRCLESDLSQQTPSAHHLWSFALSLSHLLASVLGRERDGKPAWWGGKAGEWDSSTVTKSRTMPSVCEG